MSTVRDLWEISAPSYIDYSSRLGYCEVVTRELVAMMDPETSRWVDFGCGDGRLTREFLARRQGSAPGGEVCEAILVDHAETMLTATADLEQPGVRVHRLATDAAMVGIAPGLVGHIDTIACNCSFHFLRRADSTLDVEPFLRRCGELLRQGGQLLANIPDQAYHFGDGWESRFHHAAQRLWPDSPERAQVEKFSASFLMDAAYRHGFELELRALEVPLSWDDFVHFYSIPAMGLSRFPHLSQEERVEYLQQLEPLFDEIPYRWVFTRFTNSGKVFS